MIEAENASFTYQSAPSPALQDVTLTVQPGECVVLCGRSGCGKTTFTHLLNGLSPEFYPGTLTGRCTAAGLAAGEAAIEAYVPQVGSVFQNPKTQYFNVDTTAELAFPCENAGMEPQAIRRRVDVWLPMQTPPTPTWTAAISTMPSPCWMIPAMQRNWQS